MRPIRLLHGLPAFKRLQTPVQQPLRFILFGGNKPDDIGVQTIGCPVGINVGGEALFIILTAEICDLVNRLAVNACFCFAHRFA
jgi:hypothetical protein